MCYACVHVCVYIYIYEHREREREMLIPIRSGRRRKSKRCKVLTKQHQHVWCFCILRMCVMCSSCLSCIIELLLLNYLQNPRLLVCGLRLGRIIAKFSEIVRYRPTLWSMLPILLPFMRGEVPRGIPTPASDSERSSWGTKSVGGHPKAEKASARPVRQERANEINN